MSAETDWRKSYLEAVSRHEADEQSWRRTDALLRRAVARLSSTLQDSNERLAPAAHDIGWLARRALDSEPHEKWLERFAHAIAALGEAPAAAVAAAEPVAEGTSIVGAVAQLLDSLHLSPVAAPQVQNLRERLRGARAGLSPADALGELAQIVNGDSRNLLNDKHELEQIVAQVTQRLDEVAHWLTASATHQEAARQSGAELNARLRHEVLALNESLTAAKDMSDLQGRVRASLSVVDEHLAAFRAREDERARNQQTDTEAMRVRIAELERHSRGLQASIQRERQLAATDALTGLGNRLAYVQRIERDLARWAQAGARGSLALWDIDGFKQINDSYGHQAGDKAIQFIGLQLGREIRNTDFLGRIGGDEFVMLLDGLPIAAALAKAERIRQALQQVDFRCGGQPLRITVSCGLAEYRAGDTPDSLFKRADEALYAAKHKGRNRCVGV